MIYIVDYNIILGFKVDKSSELTMEKTKRSLNNDETEKQELSLPQKRYYRQRAHSNPIADHDFD